MSESAVTETPVPDPAAPAPEATPEVAPVAAPETAVTPSASASTPSAFEVLRGQLPEGIRDDPLWNQYTERGFEGAMQDFHGAMKLVGSETRISKPAADAPQEDLDRFYNALGRPEKPEDYDLGDFAPPEGLPWSADQQAALTEKMHARGLSNEQMNGAIRDLAEVQNADYQANLQAAQQQLAEAETGLRSEWGAAYDAQMELAERAVTTFFGENGKAIMEAEIPGLGKFGALPNVARAMAKIGASMSEDKLVDGTTQKGGILTAASAKAEYDRMLTDPEISKILANDQDPQHKAMTARWNQVAALAYPEER